MLIASGKAMLMVVDVQERLVPAIEHSERLNARIQWLVSACHLLATPILFTEQYPRGLGLRCLPSPVCWNNRKWCRKCIFRR